jgi:hypothetical protein
MSPIIENQAATPAIAKAVISVNIPNSITYIYPKLNTYMELNWTHNRELQELKCFINDQLWYTTNNGGNTIIKHYYEADICNQTILQLTMEHDSWGDEKFWLSENYPELGQYNPIDVADELQEQWMVKNNWQSAMPLFGISSDGGYLDRLQRTDAVQEGRDMTAHYQSELTKTWIEKDSDGNFFKREWCDENNSFYNIQPCCVFPTNPGRTPLSDADVNRIISLSEMGQRS